jgi:ATP-binding protein involved in chromosome partitioning
MTGPFPPGDDTSTPPSPARHALAIGSGKGGVGKSTVTLNLALALVERGAAVGILDADFYGPNIPLMVGLVRSEWGQSLTLASSRDLPPIEPMERYGLKIMSVGFLIGEDQPLVLDATTVRLMLGQLLRRVRWGALDYLLIDLPPGTADVQQQIVQHLTLAGAVLVVTPQDVAHLDGKKAVGLFRRAHVPILGVVENMSGFTCPHCGGSVDVFPPVPEARAIWSTDVRSLGRVPLDPTVSQGGDRGRPVLIEHPQSPQAAAFRAVAQRVVEQLEAAGGAP